MNDICPNCGSDKTHKRGDRRRFCRDCNKSFSVAKKSENGRPPIGDKPMTGYERLRRLLDKNKNDSV